MSLTGVPTYDILVFVATIFTIVYLYYKHLFTYWKSRGLEYLEPSIPFGNTKKYFTGENNFGEEFADFYRQFKAKKINHGGVYMLGLPFYVPVDPDLIYTIMGKDFQHFVNRGFYVNENHDPLTGHLFSLEGQKWKNLRVKLSPTFTSGKMKMMFETMNQCAKGLDNLMSEAVTSRDGTDIKEILTRFTTDVISSCAFGVESNSLQNPDTEFRHIGKRIFENSPYETLRMALQFIIPRWVLDTLRFKFLKPDVDKFIMDLVGKTVEYREKNNISRKDFLHLLIQLKNRGKVADDDKITNGEVFKEKLEVNMNINELAAQVFIFFAAGFETFSTTSTFALYELAKNQEIQDKLRQEIEEVLTRHDNKITYDALMEMTYMDQVLNESLRKYPPVPMLNRECTTAYNIPGTNVQLEKGTKVVIPILAIQNDPEYYPNPEVFDPERFNSQNKNSIRNGTFLPFGEGPRICIGLRFGLMQSKIALTALLRNYRLTVNQKTKEPIAMQKNTFFIYASDSGIWLDVFKLN